MVALVSGVAMFFTVIFSASVLYPEAPALGLGGVIVGAGGILAAARGLWASSTRKVRERIGAVMDTIGQTLGQPEVQGTGTGADGEPEPTAGSG